MPPINATGRKTEDRISAIAITGPPTSFIAWIVASRGLSLLDVMFDCLHDDDRVVHHQSDREHECK